MTLARPQQRKLFDVENESRDDDEPRGNESQILCLHAVASNANSLYVIEPRMKSSQPIPGRSAPAITRWIPAFRWLGCYDRAWFRGDAVAGITLAAYLLPAAIAALNPRLIALTPPG